MDDLGRSDHVVPFMVGRHGCHQPILHKDTSMSAMDGVSMPEAEQLSPPRRLTGGDVDEEKKSLQEPVNELQVARHGLRSPQDCRVSLPHLKELLAEPRGGQDAIQEPPRALR